MKGSFGGIWVDRTIIHFTPLTLHTPDHHHLTFQAYLLTRTCMVATYIVVDDCILARADIHSLSPGLSESHTHCTVDHTDR